MPDPSKQTIMVVDDDSAIRQSLTVFLHANGYEAYTATDGYDALWHLTTRVIDVIVSDVEMPGLPGAEFLLILRQRYPKMLVVAMSERPDGQSDLGSVSADAFYQKGKQHPKNLLSTVAELLRVSKLERRNREAKFREVNISEYRRDASGMLYLQLTCPECLNSFSMVVPKGTDRTEAREASSAFREIELGYAPASCSAVAVPHTGSRECPKVSALDKLFYSTSRLASSLLSGCRYLWSGFARRGLRDVSSTGPGLGLVRDQEETEQANDGSQNSPAFHGEGREQSGKTHP
jgi:CheY-like chemotaxis protein/transposase